MNKKLFVSISALLLTVPAYKALAVPPGIFNQPNITVPNITTIVTKILDNVVWPIAIMIVIIFFMIAGFKFLTAQGDASKVADARQAVIWGLVGAAVVVLSWSAVQLAASFF